MMTAVIDVRVVNNCALPCSLSNESNAVPFRNSLIGVAR